MARRPCFLRGSGRRLPAEARRPGPADERVIANVMDEIRGRAAAIARRVLDLNADGVKRFAVQAHLEGGKMPFGVARDPAGVEIGALVADRATKALETEAVGPARDGWLVQTAMLALSRPISDRMTVQAARMGQNLSQLGEQGLR